MSHCVVEGSVAAVWCIRHPQCGSQSPLPVTAAMPAGRLLCQRGLQARSVEGKAQESRRYELQWPSGKFSPATKWELAPRSFSFHTVSHTTPVPQPAATSLYVRDGLTQIQLKEFLLCGEEKKREKREALIAPAVAHTAAVTLFDSDIVLAFLLLCQVFLQVIGVIAVAGVIIPWILIPVVPLLTVFLILRCYFLKTSRDIKRLESTSNFFFFIPGVGVGMSDCGDRQKQTAGMLIDHWGKPWSFA